MSIFKDERTTLHLMHPALSAVIASLNTALGEPGFKISINAGKRGLSVSLNGRVICKGRDFVEFSANWKAKEQAAMSEEAAKKSKS